MNFTDLITTNPNILGGQPVIKDTRIPVTLVVEEIKGGTPINKIAKEYQLDHDQIQAAVKYAAVVLKKEVILVS